MTSTLVFIYIVIVLAFIFDFINGFHDAANSIAIMVATKVLKPLTAVLWAAFFNFIVYFFTINILIFIKCCFFMVYFFTFKIFCFIKGLFLHGLFLNH